VNTASWKKQALVVHPNLEMLTAYQSLLSRSDFSVVVARDLPTALLAMTQHHFDLAILSSRLAEAGDGWTLAAVLKMAFPKSFVAVVAPGQDLSTLQAAINHGVQEVYDSQQSPEEVVAGVLACLDAGNRTGAVQASVGRVQ
jgi:DNA-binding NtrC family response regulator